MKRFYKTILGCLAASLLSTGALAQGFLFPNTSNAITNATPLIITRTVSNVGILNAAEGKTAYIQIDITHAFPIDMSISLTSPEGTTIDLSSANGSGGANPGNMTNTTFSHDASASITTGSEPFTGKFLPEESFSTFDGENADGIWTLTISDSYGPDDGILNNAAISFRYNQLFSYGLDNSSLSQDGGFTNALQLPTSGTSWTENIHNQANSALLFDGTNPATSQFQNYPTNGATFAAWIKPTNVTSDQKIICIADNSNVLDLLCLGIQNGEIKFDASDDSQGNTNVIGGSISIGEWAHVAGTWSGASGELNIYVNGNLVGTQIGGPSIVSFSAPSNSSSYKPTFGAAAWAPNLLKYTGAMDDIRAYNYAMTPWQIKDIVSNYNEYCATAVTLPVVGNSCDTSYYAHNYGGNGVNGPATNCSGNAGGASWFTVTVPASGNLNISSTAVSGSDVSDNVIEVYSGTCGNLTYIDCEDDIPGSGNSFAEVQLTGLTPGDVLYVKSWEYNNFPFGQYVMCAFEPLPLSATPSSIAPLCNGSMNGSAFVSPAGGNAPYSFSWNTGSTDSSLVNIGAGTYTCTITDNSGASYTETVVVTDPPAITVPTTTTDATGGNNNGTATANPSGGTAPYTYLWSNGNTTQTATSLGAGTFSVTITDANGCTSTGSATVNQSTAGIDELENTITVKLYPNPATDNVTIEASLEGAEETTITLLNTMGQTIQTVDLGNVNTASHTFNVRNLPAGAYFVRITTNSGLNEMKRLIVNK